MSEKIKSPYKLTHEEKKLIKQNFVNYKDWSKTLFNPIKSNIRKHLKHEQCNKCCYCKRELGNDIRDVEIEHVIPKSEYQQFTFETFNLALSCPGCNTKKGSSKVIVKPISRFPRSSNRYIIVHPHFDEYSKHINIYNDIIYVPLTKKGTKTIEICKLYRLNKVEENAKQELIKKNDYSRLTNEMNAEDLIGMIHQITKR